MAIVEVADGSKPLSSTQAIPYFKNQQSSLSNLHSKDWMELPKTQNE